jgi:hypothetical protein
MRLVECKMLLNWDAYNNGPMKRGIPMHIHTHINNKCVAKEMGIADVFCVYLNLKIVLMFCSYFVYNTFS